MKHALGPEGRDQLSDLLNLPASYGGAGLQPLEASADEEFRRSFAGISASLISFFSKAELPAYIKIAEAQEKLEELEAGSCCPTVDGLKEVNERMAAMMEPLSKAETEVAIEMVRESTTVEVPGAYNTDKPYSIAEPMTLPQPRLLIDYIAAPCKHECNVIKQVKHTKHAPIVISALNPIKQTFLRATARQCGLDSAHYHSDTVMGVAKLDRHGDGVL